MFTNPVPGLPVSTALWPLWLTAAGKLPLSNSTVTPIVSAPGVLCLIGMLTNKRSGLLASRNFISFHSDGTLSIQCKIYLIFHQDLVYIDMHIVRVFVSTQTQKTPPNNCSTDHLRRQVCLGRPSSPNSPSTGIGSPSGSRSICEFNNRLASSRRMEREI